MFRLRVTIIDARRESYDYDNVESLELLAVPKMSTHGDVTYAKVHQHYTDPTSGQPMRYTRSIYRPILAVNFEYVEVKDGGAHYRQQ